MSYKNSLSRLRVAGSLAWGGGRRQCLRQALQWVESQVTMDRSSCKHVVMQQALLRLLPPASLRRRLL